MLIGNEEHRFLISEKVRQQGISDALILLELEGRNMVTEDESTYIPIGQVHALENPGKIPLELIEVKSGAYLGEDDIDRLKDCYGRC